MEARVAKLIVEGQTAADIAAALVITDATVRTHLSSIFRKTDTKRQAELAVLLGKLSSMRPFHRAE